MFSCEFCEIHKNTFSTEHLRATASVLYIYYEKLQKTNMSDVSVGRIDYKDK